MTDNRDPAFHLFRFALESALIAVKATAFIEEMGALKINPMIQSGLNEAVQQMTVAGTVNRFAIVLWGELMAHGIAYSALWLVGVIGWVLLTQHHAVYLAESTGRLLRSLQAACSSRLKKLRDMKNSVGK
ncbi:hypothetical protein SAE02_18470 [Skermanella aerolata]|uniref:Uncharacterized protein n=1 Tax=Skermanella aerolata TaxID=393310 RepID=A0A512DMK3_9PROT|nr:hypothetical protein [Skermanella aerolata]KJB96584.1 hypothetical protein N826_32520 [Skermanella aerolata KACC 11604]GEO37699.1 hypothetical protein SAE02_18470 [Skermanella aerolata]